MSSAEPRSTGRETRLLLVTIAVSVAALLLLARFRFPEQAAPAADPAPAPLERLAARAAFDELASAMMDLERRISPRLLIYQVTPERPGGRYVVAPRITSSRATVVLGPNESLTPLGAEVEVVTHDLDAEVAVLEVPADAEAVVTPRTGTPRTGPRYVVVVEATAQGPTLRPLYVGRTAVTGLRRGLLTLLTMDGLQAHVSRGAAIFSLEGTFLGLVSSAGTLTSVFSAESLRGLAETARSAPRRVEGDLGVEVQAADGPLLRAAGAERGVVVTYVRPQGPAANALRPGDVIGSIDDVEVAEVATFRQAARTRVPGEPTTIHFVRRGTAQKVTYRAVDAAAASVVDGVGLEARSIAGVGIEVVAVEAEGAAARAGIRRGDLILTLDGEPLSDSRRLVRLYRAAKAGSALILTVERDAQHVAIAVEKR